MFFVILNIIIDNFIAHKKQETGITIISWREITNSKKIINKHENH